MKNISESRILLVCTDCTNTRILYHGIKNEIPVTHIITEQPVSRKHLIKRRIRKLGWWTTASQLLFQAVAVPLIRMRSSTRIKNILGKGGLDSSPMPEDRIIRVPSVNSDEFTDHLRSIQPDLILVNGTRIISAKTLASIQCPIINVHVGITPLYRGVHGAYWALSGKDREHCGVTVHRVDKGIDTGGILAQATIAPGPRDNFVTYPYLQMEKAIDLVRKVIPAMLDGTLVPARAPEGKSKLWYHPTIWQYLYYRLKGVK